MSLYQGLQIMYADRVLECEAQIDRFSGYYSLNFAAKGRVYFGTNHRNIVSITAPVVWWLWPGQNFFYGSYPKETWDQSYITFTGPRAKKMEFGYLKFSLERAYGSVKNPVDFRSRWNELTSLLKTSQTPADKLAYLLDSLLWEVIPYSGKRSSKINRVLPIYDLIERIQRNPSQDIDWEEEAKRMNISIAHFRRLYSELVGKSPHRHVIELKLSKAAHFISSSNELLKESALKADFEDYFYFSKLFKSYFGCSPEVFGYSKGKNRGSKLQ